jgi:hypothetical protein
MRRFTLSLLLGAGLAIGSGPGTAAAGGSPELLFLDGFESGTPWHWSALPGGVDPRAICTPPIAPVDMTGAFVVGDDDGTACDETGLRAGIAAAMSTGSGKITFDCGSAPVTITVASAIVIDGNLTIDGGGLVTLSGGDTTRIFDFSPPFNANPMPVLTLQNLTLRDGYTGNLPGNTTTSGGAAIYKDRFGHLRILDSTFLDNVGPVTGQDVAGGAIYSFGEGTTTIVRSRFTGNRCSSGGALGALGVLANHQLLIYNSLLDGNAATGSGGNPGNGGNGGAIYMDGANQSVTLCGTMIAANDANARGAGMFRVSNNGVGPQTIDRTTVIGNESPAGSHSQGGGLYLQGLQLTITASTIAGNVASSQAGLSIWTNPGAQTLSMTNSTVAENRARTSLGAGMSVAAGITGSLQHVTLARNHNEGPTSFASAISGGTGLTLGNSLIADNSKVFIWENTSCNATHAGSATFQWPQQNAGGQGELACATGTTFLDAEIGALGWSGGPTPTIAPNHPALDGAAPASCPATDQRGVARATPCTPGAVEMP